MTEVNHTIPPQRPTTDAKQKKMATPSTPSTLTVFHKVKFFIDSIKEQDLAAFLAKAKLPKFFDTFKKTHMYFTIAYILQKIKKETQLWHKFVEETVCKTLQLSLQFFVVVNHNRNSVKRHTKKSKV